MQDGKVIATANTVASKVTPANAWREYPRPQFVPERWENLNGLWDYAITPKTAPAPAKFDGQILVPFAVETSLSGVGKSLTLENRLWERRRFQVPASWKGERVLLHFGAVDYECAVWVNGGLAEAHKGGFDSFSLDITGFLKDGENELLVGVLDPTDAGEQPRGKQVQAPRGIWYTPVSGIWQTVWMEPVPATLHLAELRLTPDVDHSGGRDGGLGHHAREPRDLYPGAQGAAVVARRPVSLRPQGRTGAREAGAGAPHTPLRAGRARVLRQG